MHLRLKACKNIHSLTFYIANSSEFEFSFPSELSPSLFGLPFMNENSRGILSPTGSSFPALSTASHSPAAWADQYLAKSPQAVAGPSTTTSITRGHSRQDSAVVAKKLFEDDERTALDEFFNKTLDEGGHHEKETTKHEERSPTPVAESSATPSSGRASTGVPPAPSGTAEPRKRLRKPPISKKNTAAAKPASKVASTSKLESKEVSVQAKTEEEEEDADADADADGDDFKNVKSPAKRSRTDSATASSAVPASAMVSSTSSRPGKRSSHIASEQKRRSTIKDNYKSLVDLLLAGEASSGISLLGGGEDDEDGNEGGSKKAAKPKGRGRGRKGQDGAGATKSVVLERAADYLKWLDRGNEELEKEIGRLESILAK